MIVPDDTSVASIREKINAVEAGGDDIQIKENKDETKADGQRGKRVFSRCPFFFAFGGGLWLAGMEASCYNRSRKKEGDSMRIRDIRIRNFKSIREIHIPDIEQALILVGQNSTGKTAVLDALRAVAGSYQVRKEGFPGGLSQY